MNIQSILMVDIESLLNECMFSASRSSGPGGQNVNKVSTKIELRFNIPNSQVLTEMQKNILQQKLSGQLTNLGDLIIVSQSTRSQLKNKEEAIRKFSFLLNTSLAPVKKRKSTRPTLASRQKRLERKKHQSEKKQQRRNPEI